VALPPADDHKCSSAVRPDRTGTVPETRTNRCRGLETSTLWLSLARPYVRPSVRPLARSPATELVSPIIITVPNLLSTTLDLREAAQHTRILARSLSLAGWLAGWLALSLTRLYTLRGKSALTLLSRWPASAFMRAAFRLGKVNCGASRALWAFAAVRLRLSVWLSPFWRAPPRVAFCQRDTACAISFEWIWAVSF
jgi:hypothetical protein